MLVNVKSVMVKIKVLEYLLHWHLPGLAQREANPPAMLLALHERHARHALECCDLPCVDELVECRSTHEHARHFRDCCSIHEPMGSLNADAHARMPAVTAVSCPVPMGW